MVIYFHLVWEWAETLNTILLFEFWLRKSFLVLIAHLLFYVAFNAQSRIVGQSSESDPSCKNVTRLGDNHTLHFSTFFYFFCFFFSSYFSFFFLRWLVPLDLCRYVIFKHWYPLNLLLLPLTTHFLWFSSRVKVPKKKGFNS